MAKSDLRPQARVALGDIQGLVRFGHGHLSEAVFLLLRIEDAAAACAWLAAAPVTSAEDSHPLLDTALQIAFTGGGLRRLGLDEDAIAGFSDEFLSGMAGEDNRSRRLGDIGENSPSLWAWGGSGYEPDVLVMMYARPGGLAAWTETVADAMWSTAFSTVANLSTNRLGDIGGSLSREPFGFVDGISQPELDWDSERRSNVTELTYGNRLSLGEFVLGYRNEYGNFTDRPLLDPARDPKRLLPRAVDDPAKCDLGHNGTYLVLRDLQQDVRGFWQYLELQANLADTTRQRLAEAMVGRTMAGEPLVALAEQDITGIQPADRMNRFTFQADPYGTGCPLGAHIRRANPRNADLPDGATNPLSRLARIFGYGLRNARDDLIASTRFHRLLRRGRAYGILVPDDEAQHPGPPGEEIGLRFVCLNANISRQFEFVQTAWVAGTKFAGLTQESDPLLGNRQPVAGSSVTSNFSVPQRSGANLRLREVPQFVTVRGGAYFFLPSLSALRYLASLGD
jgi:deferrochelatase/peroxidase EfeB